MKIYLISLERDKQRRETLKKQSPNSWKKLTLVRAVDANSHTSQSIIDKYNRHGLNDEKRSLTKGEMCCAISHILALEDFLKSNDERCIIIEDDIIGEDEDFYTAIDIVKNLRGNGLLVLGGQQGLKNSKYLCGTETQVNGAWRVASISKTFLLRTCCYSVNRAAARKIVQSQKKLLRRADDWLRILDTDTDMYYSNIYKHPLDLHCSNLEKDRKINGFLNKIYSDGIIKTLHRNILKIIINLGVGIGCFVKLPTS